MLDQGNLSSLIKSFWSETHLIPCLWRHTNTPSMRHLASCPVCYNILVSPESFNSMITTRYVCVIDKKVCLVSTTIARAIMTAIVASGNTGKSISFSIIDVEEPIRAIIRETYQVYINKPIIANYQTIIPAILKGSIKEFHSQEGTLYYINSPSFSGYFYPYFFHRTEKAFPHLGFQKIAHLIDRYGFDIENIAQEIKYGEDS